MPSDSETSMAWYSDQPLDFSTKARVRLFQPTQLTPNTPKFHRLDHHHASSTTSDTTPLTMGFHRPMSRSPPPAPPSLPLHAYNLIDPAMLGMNDMFRPGLLGGLSSIGSLPSLPIPFLDNRRPSTKNVRPFKAYPRDPLTLPLGYCGLTSPLMPMDIQQGIMMNDGAYADFRKNFVRSSNSSPVQVCDEEKPSQENDDKNERDQSSVKDESSSTIMSPDSPLSPTSNSNQYLGSNKRKPRTLPDELKDEAYWERRRKNNEAAKRSRDARRAKEDEIAIRAAFLEQENLKLRVEVAALKNETAKLRCLLYNSN